jgi:hypothetical protein
MSDGFAFAVIRPLLQGSDRRQGHLHCRFRCPTTGVAARGSAALSGGEATSLLGSLGRWLADLAGSPGGESVAGDAVEAGVIAAFRQVADRFAWDGARWTGAAEARLGAAFDRRLEEAPVVAERDRALLAQLLAQVAAADREIKPSEEAFLSDVLGTDAESVRTLARRDQLRASDFAEVSPPVRETMLSLAWTLALCDADLALGELSRLNQLRGAMGVEPERDEQLRVEAQGWLLNRALGLAYAGGARDEAAYAEAVELAQGMGLSAEELEAAEAEVRGRA